MKKLNDDIFNNEILTDFITLIGNITQKYTQYSVIAYSGKKVFIKEDTFMCSNETLYNSLEQLFSNADEFRRVFEELCHYYQNLTLLDIVLKVVFTVYF